MYYTLLIQYEPFGDWIIEFGAYNEADVVYEQDEYNNNPDVFASRIIKTTDSQSAIDFTVKKLNKSYAMN